MNTATRAKLKSLLDNLFRNRSRIGEFDWAVLVPDVKSALKREMGEDSMLAEELLDDLARTITQNHVHHSRPRVPADTSQLALFYEPDALLSLGEREVIRMADARAAHLERNRVVLTSNFHAQSNAYFGWMAYIDDRLNPLRELGCTLAEVEAHTEDTA